MSPVALWVAVIASLVLSSPVDSHERSLEPTCTDIVIPVNITAQIYVLPIPTTEPPTFSTVQGAYKIAARYCEPPVNFHGRAKTLQFLVHGGTYDRNYWSGDGSPDQGYDGTEYSWIAFAGALGYPTLSIDRFCNGLSDHPDPITVCQFNAQIEVIHEIIFKARNGQLPGPANRHFNKIIYAGHSIGSFTGNLLQAKYPADVDGSILTGWSKALNLALLSSVLSPAAVPAALVNPTKWGILDPSYIALNSTGPFQTLFYRVGAYDPGLFNLDYALRGTLAYGESLTLAVQSANLASQFTGPVLVLTGQYDVLFCPPTDDQPADCGAGWSSSLSASSSLYPAARSFDTYVIPGVGHCWHFHYGAQSGFAVAHSWLASKGF